MTHVMSSWAVAPDGYFRIEADASRYCIEAQHATLSPGSEWRRSIYDGAIEQPQASPAACPDL